MHWLNGVIILGGIGLGMLIKYWWGARHPRIVELDGKGHSRVISEGMRNPTHVRYELKRDS